MVWSRRREQDDWIKECRSIEIVGRRGKDRPTEICQECIKNMKAEGLKKAMTLNKSVLNNYNHIRENV